MKKRVGFLLLETIVHWNGGLNYHRNLFRILQESGRFEPVVFTPPKVYSRLVQEFPGVEIIQDRLLATESIRNKLLRFCMFFLGFSVFLESLLMKNGVQVLSHNECYFLNSWSKVPMAAWVADFQWLHFPEHYESVAKSLEHTKVCIRYLVKYCKVVVVSSFDAKKDLLAFAEGTPETKIRVLQFVAGAPQSDGESILRDSSSIDLAKNGDRPYYVVCNQVWAHKNHLLVLRAFKVLHQRHGNGLPFRLICTGEIHDFRSKSTFLELEKFLSLNNLENFVTFTGSLPYRDVVVLQQMSLAIVQPSLFEGWSTAVEESKNIGKKMILSDIPIHREQNPRNSVYFDPYSDMDLAEKLESVFQDYDAEKEAEYSAEASEEYTKRWNQFSKAYLDILDYVTGACRN